MSCALIAVHAGHCPPVVPATLPSRTNQTLVDDLHAAAPQAWLQFASVAMGFTSRAGETRCLSGATMSEVAGTEMKELTWGGACPSALSGSAGFAAGCCRIYDRLVTAESLVIEACELMDSGTARVDQCGSRALQIRLRDVHFLISFLFEGEEVVPRSSRLNYPRIRPGRGSGLRLAG
ncbi:hypothetical protein Bcep1808_6659 (plasmid) [Burkholderia vietnamiensis G4]|uniref:Uncharacterized protein n=1 Tax=Burkholderia vietnamiensis (strain G4 / LMG 22486) TaxID=269482 RepID=A4JTE6_BURVG|nr:hypothetical protein Bcep1808_6659 [Burkholderia vietnamiensis G4]